MCFRYDMDKQLKKSNSKCWKKLLGRVNYDRCVHQTNQVLIWT